MSDILNLLNVTVPLQRRYDDFILWTSTKNNTAPEILASQLEVQTSVVDVFFELGSLDDDEFSIIDSKSFDLGLIFLIVRVQRETRNLIYKKADDILSHPQPLAALKALLDGQSHQVSIESSIQNISGDCWISISSYLKQRGIADGTISVRIRSMLYFAGVNKKKGEQISEKRVHWIIRAIEHDKSKALGIFCNDIILKDFPSDYIILKDIADNIQSYASE